MKKALQSTGGSFTFKGIATPGASNCQRIKPSKGRPLLEPIGARVFTERVGAYPTSLSWNRQHGMCWFNRRVAAYGGRDSMQQADALHLFSFSIRSNIGRYSAQLLPRLMISRPLERCQGNDQAGPLLAHYCFPINSAVAPPK